MGEYDEEFGDMEGNKTSAIRKFRVTFEISTTGKWPHSQDFAEDTPMNMETIKNGLLYSFDERHGEEYGGSRSRVSKLDIKRVR